MATATEKFFHSYAHDFDAIYGAKHSAANWLINRVFRRSMYLRYQRSIDGCHPIEGRTVVDIGCGPGHFSIALAKAGAGSVLGIDFAEEMLQVARRHAETAGVGEQCQFVRGDFQDYEFTSTFDYAIVCGFMDYMSDPAATLRKVLNNTRNKAFFSFPRSGGLLAWQRKRRYRHRCPLYLYSRRQVAELIRSEWDGPFSIDPIARDFFVTVELDKKG